MLEANTPALFAYYHEEQMLQLYVSSEANVYEIQYDENGNPRNRIDGHYMVITGMLEYSDEVAEIVGHKTMLEVSSWGEKFYIDFEDYSSALSPFANVLEIMEE